MVRFPLIAVALAMASTLSAVAAADDSEPRADLDVALELSASDRDAITMLLLQQYPILSASPGIKLAHRYRHYPSGESARVLFYPHSESRGIKSAIQAGCARDTPQSPWSCPNTEERRYVKLDTQDFEVRVVGDIDLDGVIALTEATRPVMLATRSSPTVHTLMVVLAAGDGFVVGWGSEEARETVTFEARLRDGGNPASPADWDVVMRAAR